MIPALLAKEWKDAVLEYIDTVFPIRDDRVRGAWMEFLQDPEMGLFKGIYLQARLPYRTAENPEDNPLKWVRPPFPPFAHQMKAFERLNSDQPGGPKPTLVTTGTGSGKTESFLYPVVDHCVRMRRQGQPGIKAIILYPMNALAQDQAKRLAELIDTHPETNGVITAGLYVGQGGSGQSGKADVSSRMTRDRLIEDHQVLRKYPPDILLTNYKMLDRLLQRKADASLWAANDPETLQYLVLDEFHAYDGVQLADIACLIRRLLSRLKMEPSSLCPVATSATLGDGSAQAMEELRKLAHTVFGRPFDVDAVVTESRPSLEDFLEPVMDAPIPEAVEEMLPRPQEDAEHYIRRQVKLWFGEELGGRELGERLRSHPWFDLLCRTATARPVSWDELVDKFLREFAGDVEGDREGMERRLHSFLAVVSHAKSDDRRPLLPIQVQLWTREMRGLVRGVGEKPAFRWGNQGDVHVPAEVREEDGGASNGENRKRPYIAPPEQAALPMCVCYACGVSGWISVQNEDDPRLWTDPKEISMVYGRSSHNSTPDEEKRMLRFLYPESCGAPIRGTYSEQYLTVRGAVLEQKPGPDRVKVYVVSPFDTFEKNQCPYCREKDSVLLVSMRRASLSSVLIAHTIGSAHTSDRKMLTFVDSVQDSAHLAGFIRHRTQSTLLRTGIRQMLEQGYDGATLDRLLREWQPYWRKELGDEGYLKAFVERDEEEELLAGRFPRDVSKWSEETWEDVQAYVTWRVVKELGLHARLGRSLYLTGSAVLGVSEEKLTEAARLAAESIRETEAFLDRDGRLEKRVRALIQGIVHRMILSGGISHPLLDRFREKGSRHFLTEKMNPLYERSKRHPRFFTDAKVRGDALDSLQAGEDSWIAQYLVRSLETPLLEQSFQLQHVPDKGHIALRLFQAMQKAGLADVRFFGNHHTYGLDPRALEVHKTTTRIQCRECRQELTVPRKEWKRYL
ncbi:MAG: DEAD/DEAH box helicase, partial [Planifilum fulgidum]